MINKNTRHLSEFIDVNGLQVMMQAFYEAMRIPRHLITFDGCMLLAVQCLQEEVMPLLQVRDCPEDIYKKIVLVAK